MKFLLNFPYNFFIIPGIIIWVAIRNRRNIREGLLPWYKGLEKPAWMPSGKIIGEGWVFIYTITGLAVMWFWNVPAFTWFHIIVGVSWIAIVYFHHHWHHTMFIKHDLHQANFLINRLFYAILLSFVLMIVPSPIAAFLFIPYVIWMGFARKLNKQILELNEPEKK